MAHAHSPDHPPHTIEELTRDIEAVERSEKLHAEERFLKPTHDGIGPTLGGDLAAPHH